MYILMKNHRSFLNTDFDTTEVQ